MFARAKIVFSSRNRVRAVRRVRVARAVDAARA
jgi:hypothetical protein